MATTLTTSLSAILTLLSLLLTSPSAADSDDVIAPTELATSNNEFSCEIYRQVGATPGTNVFLSPFSVLIGLGMVHAGAKGRTRLQLTKALHLERYKENERAIGDAFLDMISAVNNPSKNYSLQTANRLFASDAGLQVRPNFRRFTEEYFKADFMAMNFAGALERSRMAINEWVSDNTGNKIENLLPEGSITSDTVMLMVNAIFFKGFWANGFERKETKERTFHLSRNEHTTVSMMTRPVTEFNYHKSEDLGCEVLELPYVGNEVSMFVFLPRDVDGLPSVESKLNAASLTETFRSMNSVRVKVTLPKFGEDQGVQLRQFLEQMGMTDMFDKKEADLSGIDGKRALLVTEAVHRAFIAVDEEGTEAAASTAVVLKTKSAGSFEEPPSVVFTADRPFAYAIVNGATGCVLFLGRLVAPSITGSSGAGGDGGEDLDGRTAEKRLGGQNGAGSLNGAAPGMLLDLWLLVLLLVFVRNQV